MSRQIKVLMLCAAMVVIATMTGCKSQQCYGPLPEPCGCLFYTGSLLFVLDTNSHDGYCHVGITECDDTTLYIYEICSSSKVARRPFEEWATEWYHKFDTTYGFTSYVHYYAMEEQFDTTELLTRLSELMTNGSENINNISLLQHCYLNSDGTPVFDASYSCLTQMADTSKMFHFRLE